MHHRIDGSCKRQIRDDHLIPFPDAQRGHGKVQRNRPVGRCHAMGHPDFLGEVLLETADIIPGRGDPCGEESIERIAHFAVRQVRFRHRQEWLRPGLVEAQNTAFAIQNRRDAERLFRTAPGAATSPTVTPLR